MKIIKEYNDFSSNDENISILEDIFFELSDTYDVKVEVSKNKPISHDEISEICSLIFGIRKNKASNDNRHKGEKIKIFLEEVLYSVLISSIDFSMSFPSRDFKDPILELIDKFNHYSKGKELSYMLRRTGYNGEYHQIKLVFIKDRDRSMRKLRSIVYPNRWANPLNESVSDGDVNTISDILDDDDIEFTITPYVEKKHLQKGLHSLIGMVRVNVNYYLSKDSSLIKDMKNLFFRYMPDYIKPEEIESVNILNQSNKSLRRIFTMTGYKLKYYEFRYEGEVSYVFLYLEK